MVQVILKLLQVVSFMSPSQGAGPFYSQLAMLMISTIAATVQTYYKVNYWRKEKVAGDRESVKELVMGIVFDTYWPILGVYPSIVVWFDYKGLSLQIMSNHFILIGQRRQPIKWIVPGI